MRSILFGCLVAFLAMGLSPLAADELRINKVRAPVLMLWNDTEGSQLLKELPPSVPEGGLKVESVSDNLMLKVIVDGQEGWVFGHHVETNGVVELTAKCDPNVSTVQVGASRGLGEGCTK